MLILTEGLEIGRELPYLGNRDIMHIAFGGSLSCKQSQDVLISSHLKRYVDDASGIILPTILVPILFVSVFIPLLFMMYRSWKWEKANSLKTQQTEAKEEGNSRFDKAELSSGSSVIISEMDNPQEIQELPIRKDGLSHEMLGGTVLAQELPADIYEMPAEDYKIKSEEAKQSTKSTRASENTVGGGGVAIPPVLPLPTVLKPCYLPLCRPPFNAC